MPSRWALQGVAVQQGEAAQRPRAEHRVPQQRRWAHVQAAESLAGEEAANPGHLLEPAGVRMWLEHDSQPPKVESTKQGPIRANR